MNWLSFFFLFVGATAILLFDIETMLLINLPLIAITRGIYVLTYYLNYSRFRERDPDSKTTRFSRKERLYFIGKNSLIIVLGFVFLYIAIFFAVYSLMCAAIYIQKIGERKENEKMEKIGKYSVFIAPIVIFGLRFGDMLTLMIVIGSVALFFIWGKKYAELSIEELFKRYERRLFLKIPRSAQYFIIIVIYSPGYLLLLMLYIFGWDFIDIATSFFMALFNVNTMIFINLPIVFIARALYIYAFYHNYVKVDESLIKDKKLEEIKEEENKFKILTKNRKYYFLFINVIFIIFGFLFIFVAIFIAVYSLLVAAIYFSNLKENKGLLKFRFFSFSKTRVFKTLRIITYALIPFCITAAFLMYFDWVMISWIIIAASLAGLLFLFSGQHYVKFSLKEMYDNLNRKYSKNTKSLLKYFLILYIVSVPTIFILGFYAYGDPHKETIMIEMRDGTELSTNIYYSPLEWEWDLFGGTPKEAPVVLIRTPYNKDAAGMDYYASLYLAQGYHVVFQDLRNTFASEGDEDDLMFASSYLDGVDTIEWILDQDWCNGKIGSVGASALAINSIFYAGMEDAYDGKEGLRCQSLMVGIPDLYLYGILDGCFRYDLVVNWIKSTSPDNYRYQLDTIYNLLNTQNRSDPAYLATTLNAGINNFSNVNARALHIAGWYDVFLPGTIAGYRGYNENGTSRARDHQKLIIYPGTHGAIWGGQQGDLIYPDSASAISLIFKWEKEIFDESLKGADDEDIWDGNNVAYYVMGDPSDKDANYWKYTKEWPLRYDENEWYFGLDEDGDGIVVDSSSDLDGYNNISYLYDPRDPCPTIGGNNLGNAGDYSPGPIDQRDVEGRDDVIVFDSEKFDKAYTVEGDLKVRLNYKSNCSDTDFMVKLCDVYPDGRSMLIIDGARMARLRNSYYEEDFIEPGTEYSMEISLASIAYRFDVGHRIRISVTSSNYPRYAINHNTNRSITDNMQLNGNSQVAKNTIITGPGKSCIIFPELD